jgi:hypothetical protein
MNMPPQVEVAVIILKNWSLFKGFSAKRRKRLPIFSYGQ